MDISIQSQDCYVISLKEITDILNVRHNDAVKKVEKLSEEPSFGSLRKTRSQYQSGKGRLEEIDTYEFTKRQAVAVGAKLNDSLLMKLIDRLEEIENKKNTPQLPQNYIEALEALTKSEKEKLALTEKIKEKDDVILAVSDLNIRAGDVSIADFAKNLAIEGLGQNNLFSWLKGRGYLMMNTAPYQQYVERGYFVRKPYEKKVQGEVKYRTMLTPKGTVWLTKILKAEFEIGDEK